MSRYVMVLLLSFGLLSCANRPGMVAETPKTDEALLLPRERLAGWEKRLEFVLPPSRTITNLAEKNVDFPWFVAERDASGAHVLNLPALYIVEFAPAGSGNAPEQRKFAVIQKRLPDTGAALMRRIFDACEGDRTLFGQPLRPNHGNVNGFPSTVQLMNCKEGDRHVLRFWHIIDGAENTYVIGQVHNPKAPQSLTELAKAIEKLEGFAAGRRGDPPSANLCDFAATRDRCAAAEASGQYFVIRKR